MIFKKTFSLEPAKAPSADHTPKCRASSMHNSRGFFPYFCCDFKAKIKKEILKYNIMENGCCRLWGS